jgi:hypothetical protein
MHYYGLQNNSNSNWYIVIPRGEARSSVALLRRQGPQNNGNSNWCIVIPRGEAAQLHYYVGRDHRIIVIAIGVSLYREARQLSWITTDYRIIVTAIGISLYRDVRQLISAQFNFSEHTFWKEVRWQCHLQTHEIDRLCSEIKTDSSQGQNPRSKCKLRETSQHHS